MLASKSFWIWGLALASIFLVGWRWQRESLRSTQIEISGAREALRDLEGLRRENQRLGAEQVTEAALANLRADHEAVARLRGEIDGMKRRSEAAAGSPLQSVNPISPEALAALLAVPPRNWTNAGRHTPGAALETALWAGKAGELDAMAATFALDGTARRKAEAILAGLPEADRVRLGTPEKLIADLVSKELPQSLGVLGATGDADTVKILLHLQQRSDASVLLFKETELALRRSSDGWRLVIPEGAVDNYAAALKLRGNKSR